MFDGTRKRKKFFIGVIPGSHSQVPAELLLNDSREPTAHSFIRTLRPICETIFNLLLVGYIAGLKAFRDRSILRNEPRKITDDWDKSIKFAEEALQKSQDAEVLRQDNSIVEADTTTATAFEVLKLRYDFLFL